MLFFNKKKEIAHFQDSDFLILAKLRMCLTIMADLLAPERELEILIIERHEQLERLFGISSSYK